MLLYMPEMLYEYVKNDEYYHRLSKKYTDEIFHNKDFINIIGAYENDNPILIEMADYIRKKLPEKHLLEYDVLMSDNLSEFDNRYAEMDVETQIFYLYAYNQGDMTWSPEADRRNKEVINLYEEFILGKNVECSLFIHVIYYFRKVYELIRKYSNRKLIEKEFEKFVSEETRLFEMMRGVSDNESFKHIMFSKREQMYILYMEFIGQMMHNSSTVFDKIWNIINNKEFKYNYFSYFKMTYAMIRFRDALDGCDFNLSKQYLDMMIELINYAFENKADAVDSLNHYNKAFTDEFLMMTMFINNMINDYMPNLKSKWNFLKNKNMEPIERGFFTGNMTNSEREMVKYFNAEDNIYSRKWAIAKSDILKELDKNYA